MESVTNEEKGNMYYDDFQSEQLNGLYLSIFCVPEPAALYFSLVVMQMKLKDCIYSIYEYQIVSISVD